MEQNAIITKLQVFKTIVNLYPTETDLDVLIKRTEELYAYLSKSDTAMDNNLYSLRNLTTEEATNTVIGAQAFAELAKEVHAGITSRADAVRLMVTKLTVTEADAYNMLAGL